MLREKIVLFKRLSRFAGLHWQRWLAIIFLGNTAGLLALVNPSLSRIAIDDGIMARDLAVFVRIVVIGAAVVVVTQALRASCDYFSGYLRAKVNFEMNRRFYRHIIKMPIAWFKDRSTGEHIYKIDYDITTASDFVVQAVPEVLSIALRFAVTLTILFFLSANLACLVLALGPVFYILSRYSSRPLAKMTENFVEVTESIVRYLEENFSHIPLIKAFGRELSSLRGYVQKTAAAFRAGMRVSRFEIANNLAGEAAAKIMTGVLVFYGGTLVIQGRLTLGAMTAVLAYVYQLVGLYQECVSFVQGSISGFVSLDRLSGILDAPVEREVSRKKQDFGTGVDAIAFEQVSFGYKEKSAVLDNVTFKIEAGRHVALVGRSGSGKTTLLNLILRLYEPWRGIVRIAGDDARDLGISLLRQDIGFVLQEPFLWNDTIENNIRYGNPAATSIDIEEAARLSGVDEFVARLPAGAQTLIGENACRLSEGQKQKIAIARALVKKSGILIFDEAMASMDSASEERILANIKNERDRVTLIVVSHRLSAVKAADLVYYLVSPNEVLIDTPENFLKNNESFVRLFAGQTQRGV
jgi:ABC-type bacteriocin/lantibiotic exporter with double-glycine peptidase domain